MHAQAPLSLTPSNNFTSRQLRRCIRPEGFLLYECEHGSTVYIPQRCRTCKGCQKHKADRQLARILFGIRDEPWLLMLTLTSLPGSDWQLILRTWNALYRHLKKADPHLAYAAVKEIGTKSGSKHLHVLLKGWRWHNVKELRTFWKERTGADQIHLLRLPSPETASYCAKYLSKEKPGIRRSINYSRSWPKLPNLGNPFKYVAGPQSRPPAYALAITLNGILIERLATDCTCCQDIDQLHPLEEIWLKYYRGP